MQVMSSRMRIDWDKRLSAPSSELEDGDFLTTVQAYHRKKK